MAFFAFVFIRHKGEEARVALTDVVNVDYTSGSPVQIILMLSEPVFGRPLVKFATTITIRPFIMGHPVQLMLIERVGEAKRKGP